MTGAKITTPVSFLDILPLWALFHTGGGPPYLGGSDGDTAFTLNLLGSLRNPVLKLSWPVKYPPPPYKVGMYSMAINVLISAHLQRVVNRKRTGGPPPAM